jgi:beta-glucosidase
MNLHKLILILSLPMVCLIACQHSGPLMQAEVQDRSLLELMTIEQKINMVSGTRVLSDISALVNDKVPGSGGYTFEIPELDLPALTLADGPAGLRISPTREDEDDTFYATAFPIATLLASTWNTELVEQIGSAIGKEVKEYGVDILLGPALNLHRNPLTGRNFEYYTEDPYLNGHMAASMVNGIQAAGVGATLKHYAANNQETNRFLLDTIVSERALREIYLKGFEIAVKESKPWAVMSAYNMINGDFASQNNELLITVLRDEWGFDGLVMTDWFAGNDAVAQMLAGNDLLMPGTTDQTEQLMDAVVSGRLDETILDRNIQNILGTIYKSPTFKGYVYNNNPDLQAHAQMTRRAAAEGVVLLKNDNNTLPRSLQDKKIAAFGNTSYDFKSGGTGSGDVNEAYTVSLVEGLETVGFIIDRSLKADYEQFIRDEKSTHPERKNIFDPEIIIPEMSLSFATIEEKSLDADLAIVTIGRNSGEFQDRKLEDDFNLTAAEHAMLSNVSMTFRKQGKPVVVILNIGNVIETVSWRALADAIVVPWQGGQEAGNALVDVLTGRVNPSGKLSTSFPVNYSDVPSANNFPGEFTTEDHVDGWSRFSNGRYSEVVYEEGIYVGYRYYTSFNKPTAYEFGFGLSYTEFEYGDIVLNDSHFRESINVSVAITNVGEHSGKEVVQLYLTAPQGRLDKPELELKGFAKTRLLKSQETQVIEFTLNAEALTSFDTDRSAWVANSGDYMIRIGASVLDIRRTASFKLDNEMITLQTHKAMPPKRQINELKNFFVE